MEDLLLNIVKEATCSKLLNLKKSAQEAHGKYHFHFSIGLFKSIF